MDEKKSSEYLFVHICLLIGNLPLIESSDPESFVKSLKRPCKIILFDQTGKPIDATIGALVKYLERGDTNEWYRKSIRRSKE